jgi:hypothetical protein
MIATQTNSKDKGSADLLAQIESLKAENAKLKEARLKSLSMKVSEKGALSVYGLGRFPVSLYRQQWERLISLVPAIQEFIKLNAEAFVQRLTFAELLPWSGSREWLLGWGVLLLIQE